MATRTITLAFTGDTRGLDQAAQRGGKEMDTWQDKFKKWNKVAVAASIGVMVAAGKVAMDARTRGREIVQNQRLQEVAFGDSLAAMQEWAEGVRRSAGMSAQQVLDLTTNSQDMLVGFGMATDQAAELTRGNFELAQALADASGGALTVEDAMERLTKASVGQTDGLKALGTVIDAQMIKERLREQGLDHLTGMERKQAEAIAIQEIAYEQNQHKVDAWNESGREAAEQQNSLSSTVETLKDNLAKALIPAFERADKIISNVSKVVEGNQKLIAILAGTVVGLAGFVLGANAAWKIYTASKKAVILVTRGLTLAQRGLNLVLRANPIGLVITAVMLLVGAFVAAYKNSETFRRIVDAAFRAVRNVVLGVVTWFRTTVPAAFVAVRDRVRAAIDSVKAIVVGLRDTFRGVVASIRGIFSGVASAISAPFRSAFNSVRSLWNSTIGRFRISIPAWVPVVGGRSFNFPRMATGGHLRPGRTVLVGERGPELLTLMGGAGRITPNHELGSAGGTFEGTLVLDSGEFLGKVRGEIRRRDRDVKRAVLAGSGRR